MPIAMAISINQNIFQITEQAICTIPPIIRRRSNMHYAETTQKLNEYRARIAELRAEMREIQASIEPEEVGDYEFSTPDGPITLSALFGRHDSLIMIHNMGARCRYCTLWADGFNGLVDHLENRAAFVVSSPDSPDAQQKFSEIRGWRFRMVSHERTSFADDMGYRDDSTKDAGGPWQPGVSVFKKSGDRVERVSDASLGPGDDFCVAWHLFDLLPEGPAGWGPQYRYD
jgi:predicted dithiol-disulfide oxidoreductase (DUF899 family)